MSLEDAVGREGPLVEPVAAQVVDDAVVPEVQIRRHVLERAVAVVHVAVRDDYVFRARLRVGQLLHMENVPFRTLHGVVALLEGFVERRVVVLGLPLKRPFQRLSPAGHDKPRK